MTEIMVYVEDYQQPATCVAQSRRIFRWIIANRFSYQQVIHILLPLHVFISERMIHGLGWVSQCDEKSTQPYFL
jgi:hypothetical protein